LGRSGDWDDEGEMDVAGLGKLTGWWFGTMEIIISIYWKFHHPN
jgi:hypothetical protein